MRAAERGGVRVADVFGLTDEAALRAGPRLILAAARPTPTNRALVETARRMGLPAHQRRAVEAARTARPNDIVLARIDVRPTLDGMDPGLGALGLLLERDVRVLNPPSALLAAHDKLETARRLAAAGLPHPYTAHVTEPAVPAEIEGPAVVKPRFGSWGRDVVLCATREQLETHLRSLRRRPWFRRHGALVQAVVPLERRDLRIVVAGGEVVGAIERVAAPGEWRTNIALGGHRRPVVPSAAACSLALDAVRAVSGDLLGVDLLPDGNGGYVVLELNGAVEFTEEYSLGDRDVFERALVGATLGTVDDAEPVLSP